MFIHVISYFHVCSAKRTGASRKKQTSGTYDSTYSYKHSHVSKLSICTSVQLKHSIICTHNT